MATLLESYIEKLKNHDWFYAMSDDPRIESLGQKQRMALIAHQRSFDKDFEIWNQHAPEQFKKKIANEK